jgi:hypothetical protein
MSHDPLLKQDLALALARTLVNEIRVPREMPAQAAHVRLQQEDKVVDSTELGGKLLKELDRLGYSVVRHP